MDWELFNFDYQLDPTHFRDLISIEASKEAASSLVLPPDWREQLDRLNRVRAVHGTTALEGNPLSEAEVSKQMEALTSPVPARSTKEQIQIRNAGKAQEIIRSRFHPDGPEISVEDILHLHEITTSDSDEHNNSPGKFRTFSVTVGSAETGGIHRGAPAERVPDLMKEFILFVNSRKLREQHPVVRALLAHFFLVTIHPFGDGNGRVSRLVEAAILFEGGYNVHGFYGLSNYFYRNEQEYKTRLQGCRATQPFDATGFVEFGLKGFAEELKGINNFIKTKLNRLVYRTVLVRAFRKRTGERRRLLNTREFNLLEFLLTQTEPIDPFSPEPSRKISLSELAEAPFIKAAYRNVTSRTFNRELFRLADLGFISFGRAEGGKDWIVTLDFGAIGRY
jgi:Fic family protein